MKTLTPEERLTLARQVYDAAVDATETFGDDKVGVDLSYLLGAIVGDGYVDWSVEARAWGSGLPRLHQILMDELGADHTVWDFVRL